MMLSTSFKCSPIVRLLQPEDRLALGSGDPAPTAGPASGFFARERENVGQEGFDALVHRVSPPYRLQLSG